MTITWRVPLLMLAGIVPVVLRPAAGTAAIWVLLVVVLTLADVLLAPKPATLEITRVRLGGIRLGESTTSELVVRSPARRVRAVEPVAEQHGAAQDGGPGERCPDQF